MKKVLFACALEREMKDLQRFYNENKNKLPYNCDFIRMGYGRSEVVKSLIQILPQTKYDILINVGTCGIKIKNKEKKYQIGDLLEPFEVYDGDYILENEIRKLSLKTSNEIRIPLVTISSFGRYDSYMNRSYIEDMEGYEVANICSALKQPFKIMKVISNYITDNFEKDLSDFYKNCVNVMVQNTENIFNNVNDFFSEQ